MVSIWFTAAVELTFSSAGVPFVISGTFNDFYEAGKNGEEKKKKMKKIGMEQHIYISRMDLVKKLFLTHS